MTGRQVLHRKYALGLAWSLRPFALPPSASPPPPGACASGDDAAAAASRCVIEATLGRVEDVLRRAEADFADAFASSFAQVPPPATRAP